MDSRSSFSRTRRRTMGFRFMLLCVISVCSAACVTVRPEQKELLADPSMTFGSGGPSQMQEEHVLNNREGSFGGGGVSGGGCGCN